MLVGVLECFACLRLNWLRTFASGVLGLLLVALLAYTPTQRPLSSSEVLRLWCEYRRKDETALPRLS